MVATYIVGPDPDWQRQMNERMGRALTLALSMIERKREERDRQMARDWGLMVADPTLASGSFGKQFAETYASNPQAQALVADLAGQGRREGEGRDSYDDWLEGIGLVSKERAAIEDERMSREAFEQSPSFIGPPDPPELEAKQAADRAIESARRGSPEWEAISRLDTETQAEARRYAVMHNLPIPEPPAALSGYMPKELLGLMASGLPAEDVYQAFRIDKGLEPSASVQAQLDSAAEGREAAERRMYEGDRLQRERAAESERLRRERPQRQRGGAAAKEASPDEVLVGVVAANKKIAEQHAEGAPVPPIPDDALPDVADTIAAIAGPKSEKVVANRAMAEYSKWFTDPEYVSMAKNRGKSPLEMWMLWVSAGMPRRSGK